VGSANGLRARVDRGIDGEKSQDIVDLLDQVKRLLYLHAENKRYISDVWTERDTAEEESSSYSTSARTS
jgi:hypothetical protein